METWKTGAVLLTVAAAGAVTWSSTSYMRSNWHEWEVKSDATMKTANSPAELQKAEDQLMKSIEISFKDKVPEKKMVHVYEKMGDLMMREGKFEEAEKYYLRIVQFNNALHVETDENIAQLKKLENSYEQARDYSNASQTQAVLVKLIELEKSPSNPQYATEKARADELAARLVKFENPEGIPKVKVAQHVSTPQEQKQNESLLTGWH